MRYKRIKKLIYDNYWYIVSLKNILNPKLLYNHFDSEESAKNGIKKYLNSNFKKYDVISGEEAKKLGFTFIQKDSLQNQIWKEKVRLEILKYDYPKERTKGQKRKTYRTIMRRIARGEIMNPQIKLRD